MKISSALKEKCLVSHLLLVYLRLKPPKRTSSKCVNLIIFTRGSSSLKSSER